MAKKTPLEKQWEKDRKEDNDNRANCAADALRAYRQSKDEVRDADEADFSDLLCDLMHYARREGLEFEEEAQRAKDNFEAEI